MHETWKEWVGRTYADEFPLRAYLGGGERNAVFLTQRRAHPDQQAIIKFIRTEPEIVERENDRLQHAAELIHPNLLRIFRAGHCRVDESDFVYAVMEFAEENLAQVIPARALSPAEVRELLSPTLDALAYAHSKGWVHTRLKPSNILSVAETLKLSIDGLRRMGETRDQSWKPGIYDPPGLPGRRISAAGDVWALGVTLVMGLTQHEPVWSGSKSKEPTLPETLPAPFRDIAVHCLQPDPDDRWTIPEVTAALRNPTPASREPAPAGGQEALHWLSRALLWQPWCPYCHSSDMKRSRRRTGAEKVLAPLVLPYRCHWCGSRFLRLRRKER